MKINSLFKMMNMNMHPLEVVGGLLFALSLVIFSAIEESVYSKEWVAWAILAIATVLGAIGFSRARK